VRHGARVRAAAAGALIGRIGTARVIALGAVALFVMALAFGRLLRSHEAAAAAGPVSRPR
jgi:hypothetical protein